MDWRPRELAALGAIEREQGRIVGAGLTLRETPHVFEVESRRLYTWCALDALMFPAIFEATCRVVSPCPVSGTLVSLDVSAENVWNVDPPSAVISMVLPDASAGLRCSFCERVRLFASADGARAWTDSRATMMRIEVGFQFGADVARRLGWRR